MTFDTVVLAASIKLNFATIADNFPPVKLSMNVKPAVCKLLIVSKVAATVPLMPPPFWV